MLRFFKEASDSSYGKWRSLKTSLGKTRFTSAVIISIFKMRLGMLEI